MEVQSDNAKFNTPFPWILNISDSSSTVGWLRKSNHDPIDAPHSQWGGEIPRTQHDVKDACNYSQHFPGKLNVTTDSFSRDFHLSNNQIISMLTSLNPSLSTSQINMIELPQKNTPWIVQLEQKCPGKKGSPKQLIKSDIAAGIIGLYSYTGSTTTTTPIWTRSKNKKIFTSVVISCVRCDAVILGENLSKETLRERPLTMWQRPLWKVIVQAPSQTQ